MNKRLSVNINKVALLRNARNNNIPDLLQFASDCEAFGADGITVHPRPDERHIRRSDVYALKKQVTTELNIEGYPSEEFLQLIEDIKPDQVTLVPDAPDVLTSDNGWDTIKHQEFLTRVISRLKKSTGRVSVFLNACPHLVPAAAATGAHRIELYTGPYAEDFEKHPEKAIDPYLLTAQKAGEYLMGVNGGHDLNLKNLNFFSIKINNLLEVSIGHALIADALYFGIENTIQMYKKQLK